MQPKHAAINKITPPDFPEIIARERLFDLLDRRRHHRFTWISGAAGSGKTTLVTSYLTARGIPCLWYRLDERDGDPSTFFYFMGLAARKALPRMRKKLPWLTIEQQENPFGFAQSYFEALCEKMPLPFCMVYDNFENVPGDAEFSAVFEKALEGISPDIHVLILSRTDPPPVFSGMLAKRHMRVVGQQDLDLNPEETARFLEKICDISIKPEAFRSLHQQTRGWAAGLILTIGTIQRGAPLKKYHQENLPGAVNDYFTHEIFNRLNQRLKDFLMRVAFLPTATSATAGELTGESGAAEILASIYRDHLFIERFSASAYTYRFHPMFREFLLAEAREYFEIEETDRLWRRAAGIMETTGQIEDAVECLERIQDVAEIARLIQTHAVGLIQQGRLETLGTWLEKIPETTMAGNPWLLFWMGMRFRPGEARQATLWFEKAFTLFEKNNDVIGTYLSWSRIIDSIILAWDDFTQMDPWIDWFDKASYLENMPPLTEIQARVAASMSGALIIRRPQHPDLASWLDSGLDLCRGIKDITTQLKTCIWSATYHMWNGDFARADIDRDIAGKMIKRRAPSPVIQRFWDWLDVSADIRTMAAPGKALNRILLLLKEADKEGQHFGDHLFFPPGMFAAFTLGQFDKAKKLLARFGRNTDDSRRQSLVIYYHFQSLYCLLKGRLKQASVYAEYALDTVRQTGYVFYEALCLFQAAHVSHQQGRRKQAEETLNRAEGISVKTESHILQYMCLLKKAHLYLTGGKRKKGLETLGRAMAMGRRSDYMSLAWWWDPAMLSYLCGEAVCADIESDYARRFARLHELRPDPQFMHLEKWPWPVKIHTFGRFQVQVDGKPLAFGRRPPKKPLELLQALVAFGGADVPVARILDELWPDADGDSAHSAFSTALNRLRKLLRNKQAIVTSSGRISLNPNSCWVDCLAFKHARVQGDTHWNRQEMEAALGCYRQAVAFYQGLFLFSENPLPWVIAARERLKNRFIGVTLKMGQWLEKRRHFDAAVACYREGLSADDLEEALYQHLMAIQIKLARHADAVRTYQHCKKRLADVLGVAPSPVTEELYHRAVNRVK